MPFPFPFFYSTLITLTAPSVGLSLDWLATAEGSTSLLAGGAVIIYALRKLDTISDILSWLLGTLVVCTVIVIIPAFEGSTARAAASEILTLMIELMRALVELIKSWIAVNLPQLIGGTH